MATPGLAVTCEDILAPPPGRRGAAWSNAFWLLQKMPSTGEWNYQPVLVPEWAQLQQQRSVATTNTNARPVSQTPVLQTQQEPPGASLLQKIAKGRGANVVVLCTASIGGHYCVGVLDTGFLFYWDVVIDKILYFAPPEQAEQAAGKGKFAKSGALNSTFLL